VATARHQHSQHGKLTTMYYVTLNKTLMSSYVVEVYTGWMFACDTSLRLCMPQTSREASKSNGRTPLSYSNGANPACS
jgi:hypothetical protein